MKKRIFSLFLALVIALSVLPAAALASEPDPSAEEQPAQTETGPQEEPSAGVPSGSGTPLDGDVPDPADGNPVDGNPVDTDPVDGDETPAEPEEGETAPPEKEASPVQPELTVPEPEETVEPSALEAQTDTAAVANTGSVTVDITAQAENEFLFVPQFGVSVSGSLAEGYGYTDSVTAGVSALDVLVKAHETKYGEQFTPETAQTYLTVADGYVTKQFGTATINAGFAVNGLQPAASAVNAAVKDGDIVSFFLYQDGNAADNFLYLTGAKANLVPISAERMAEGCTASFYVYGYPISQNVGGDENSVIGTLAPQEEVRLCTVDAQTGAKTDISGSVSDRDGMVKLTFDQKGEYLVSAYMPDGSGTPAIMPLMKITVVEAPKLASLDIYLSQDDYQNGGTPVPISPDFRGEQLTGYSTVLPDYLTKVFLAAKFPGQDGIITMYGDYKGTTYTMFVGTNIMGYVSAAGAYDKAMWNNGYITFYFSGKNDSKISKVSNYQISVTQYATLKSLTVDGVMKEAFDRETRAYTVLVDSTKESVDVTAAGYSSVYSITIGDQTVKSGTPVTVSLAGWDKQTPLEVPVTVSGSSREETVYTLTLKPMPREDKPFIASQPVGAVYVVGDKTAPLSVVASANGALTYQWYRSETEDGGNASLIEAADKAEYTPSAETAGGTYYFCRVTNTEAAGNNVIDTVRVLVKVLSDPTPVVTLNVQAPKITDTDREYAEEYGFVYDYGQTEGIQELTATWSSAAGDDQPEGSVYWWWSEEKDSWSMWLGEGLAVTPNTDNLTDNGFYIYCEVYYTFNGKVYTGHSDYVYVYVKVKEEDITLSAEPLQDVEVTAGTRFNLSVRADAGNVGKLTYQWYQNTEPGNEGGTPIEGATNWQYAATIDEPDILYYYCVVTNRLQGFEKTVVTNAAKVTVLEAADETVDSKGLLDAAFTGSGTEEEPYQLAAAEDFTTLAELVKGAVSVEGVCFAMTADVTLPAGWDGIGALKPGTLDEKNGVNMLPFTGILDGQGHTLTFAEGSKALLTYARAATVKNLNIYAPYMNDYALLSKYVVDYGSTGSYSGTPPTINVSNVTLKSGSMIRMGGFLGGYASGLNICTFTGCLVEQGVKIGCNQDGTSAGNSYVGSFAGDVNGTFTNCVSYADVYGVDRVGGIAGSKGQSMGPCIFTNCAFYGTITASGSYVGGIMGAGYGSASAPNSPCVNIQNCAVAANITGGSNVGGIFGGESAIMQAWGAAYIRNNMFCGSITASDGTVGGLIGYMYSLNKFNILENNFYCAEGVEKAIGGVRTVDTSCETHETASGAEYLNTALELPADTTGVSRRDHNRTDDPLGADSARLGRRVTAGAMADGSVAALLNSGEGSLQNWEQGVSYPIHGSAAVITGLTAGGDYKTTYYVGDALDLTGIVFTVHWSDGSTTTPAPEEVTVTGFDSSKRGTQLLTASYGTVTAEFTVTVLLKPEPSGSNEITVTFTLLGDVEHDNGDPKANGGPHTLKDNNLEEWIPKTSYTVDLNATVKDVFETALRQNGITWENPSGNYVESITRGGVTLAEFTNGNLSGWMYTVNQVHSSLGVSEQYLNNGDDIVFHYTDDYTKEQGSEQWNGGGSSGSGAATPGNADPEPGEDGTTETKPPVTVDENGEAKVELTAEDVNLVIDEAKAAGADVIVIAPDVTGEADKVTVTLPSSSIADIVQETKASLAIKTDIADVTVSAAGLAELGKEEGADIAISAKVLKDESENATGMVRIEVTVNSKPVETLDGGLLVTLPASPEELGTGSVMVLVGADGKETVLKKSVQSERGVTALLDGSCTVKVVDNAASFSDTAQHWASAAIDFVSSRELFHGTAPGVFDPGGNMTRSMLVTVLHRLEDTPDVSTWNSFGDVAGGTWYTSAVSWASENGIVNGYSASVFAPDDNVTREQIAVMLYRYANFLGLDVSDRGSMTNFTDTSSVSGWASEAMEWAVGVGLIEGKDGGVLDPGGNATRAEVAAVLQRLVPWIVLSKAS